VNPLTLKLPRGKPVPRKFMAEFKTFKKEMDIQLASITSPAFAVAKYKKDLKPSL